MVAHLLALYMTQDAELGSDQRLAGWLSSADQMLSEATVTTTNTGRLLDELRKLLESTR
jgi:hypothetical protein